MKMKKAIVIWLLFSLLICFASPTVTVCADMIDKIGYTQKSGSNGTTSNESNLTSVAKRTGITYSCSYDNKKKEIHINGSVAHEVFVAHRDYSVNLYKIDIKSSLDGVLKEGKPLASTEISIKFNFVVSVESVMDILSQYVVVLVSPSGSPEFIGAEFFPSVESEFVSDTDRNLYKGFETSSATLALESVPSVAVIPISLNKLVSSGYTGYLYSFEDSSIFFDKQYIDQLDILVRNLSSVGSRIYFRLLLESEDSSSGREYAIPDMYSDEATNMLYAYCDFLSSRYSSYKYGNIGGMIIGKNLDDVERCNQTQVNDIQEYAEVLARYGMTVSVAVRKHIPSADIVYSFSNVNSYSEPNSVVTTEMCPSMIIEGLCNYFDEYYSGDFDFTITVESSTTPLNISELSSDKSIDISAPYDDNYVTEANISVISEYLDHLEKSYESFPKDFMYVWEPTGDVSGNALSCAYSYLYYKLFSTDKLSAFVVSFDESDGGVHDVLSIIKYIDTQNGWYFTSPLLSYFNKTSWAQVFSNFRREEYLFRYHKSFSSADALPINIAGRFSYFDLAKSSDKSAWFAGSGSSAPELYNSDVLGRALCANMSFDVQSSRDYSHLFYAYEYSENFVYTPHVSIRLLIESESKSSEIFELKVSFIDSNNVYEFSQIVYTDEESYVYVDLSDFSKEYMADYIQFSIRPMGESAGNYKLLISSLEGVSTKYNSDELEKLISSERLRIRNLALEKENISENDISAFIPLAVIVIAGIIAVMLFFFLRRDDNAETDENKKG